MKNFILTLLFLSFFSNSFAQGRPINKLTLETTYSYVEISKKLRDVIEQPDKSSYFDDSFFNAMLKQIVSDKNYTDKEKVQLFYLMQKKLGFAFVGINYLPPKQNYFSFFMGEIQTWQKTRKVLKDVIYNTSGLLALVDSSLKRDPIVASNALLLAALLNAEYVTPYLHRYSETELILSAKNPDIFNHYVCLAAGIRQDTIITDHLVKNVLSFKSEPVIEDALCALYAKSDNLVSTIKEYILQEQNPQNELAVQTALGALYARVPLATFQKSVKSFINEAQEPWKKDICKKILENKMPYNYSITNPEQIVTKKWDGVTLSLYTDGALISNGTLLEFDPN